MMRQAVPLILCGLLALPALHGLVRHRYLASSTVLVSLGFYAFVIYLLNTPFIGFTKAVMLKVMPWDGLNFLIFVPVLMAAGVLGPILTKQILLSRVPVLDRMTQ